MHSNAYAIFTIQFPHPNYRIFLSPDSYIRKEAIQLVSLQSFPATFPTPSTPSTSLPSSPSPTSTEGSCNNLSSISYHPTESFSVIIVTHNEKLLFPTYFAYDSLWYIEFIQFLKIQTLSIWRKYDFVSSLPLILRLSYTTTPLPLLSPFLHHYPSFVSFDQVGLPILSHKQGVLRIMHSHSS